MLILYMMHNRQGGCMKDATRVKRYVRIVLLHMWVIGWHARAEEQPVNFDELLEKTSYAVLLKELISLSDTIGLLHCRMQKDERRFVEDSILGKVVRVQDLFGRTDLAHLPEDDVEYLLYWISLAKGEVLPQLLSRHIADLERVFCGTCARNLNYRDGEL